jgi:hypothetical protein
MATCLDALEYGDNSCPRLGPNHDFLDVHPLAQSLS